MFLLIIGRFFKVCGALFSDQLKSASKVFGKSKLAMHNQRNAFIPNMPEMG